MQRDPATKAQRRYPGMTNLAAEVRALWSSADEDPVKALKQQYAIINNYAQQAADAGTLYGQCLFLSTDDGGGQAVYEIAWADKKETFLRFVPLFDSYHAEEFEGDVGIIADPYSPDDDLFAVSRKFVEKLLNMETNKSV